MTDKPSRAAEKAEERRKKRLGFEHVSGWVRTSDAPAIRRVIEKAKEEVEAIRDDL